MPIEIKLLERNSADYIYIDADNKVHLLLPLIAGKTIGTDNTCKIQLELQRFFGLGTDISRQGQPNSAKEILVKYKKALEHDITVLNPIDPQGSLITIKRARLEQITSYITLLQTIEPEWQTALQGKNPELPAPMLRLLNAKTNCLSIQLSPKIEDRLIRTKNPVFSVARKPRDEKGAENYPQDVLDRMHNGQVIEWDHPGLGSTLRAGLKTAVNRSILSIKEGLISPIINSNTFNHVTEWGDDEIAELQRTLNHAIKEKLDCDVDCSKNDYSQKINADYITNTLLLEQIESNPPKFEPINLSLKDMIEFLLDASLSHDFWNNHHPIFMPTGDRADLDWLEKQVEILSIKVQFFLAQVNIYCREHQLLRSPDTNLGQLFDRQWIADDIVNAINHAFNTGGLVEANLFNLINNLGNGGTTNGFLSRPLNSADKDKIMSNFISQYNIIAESPHFDEFIIFLNEKTTGDFFNHHNRISVHVWDVLTVEQKNRYPLLNRHAALLKNTSERCLSHINPVDNSVRVEDINPANGNTPLHLFAELGDEDKVSEVLDYFFKTDKNLYDQTNNKGCTALHLACIHGNNNIVRALINTNKINLLARNRDGDNIIDLAIKHNKKDLLLLLVELLPEEIKESLNTMLMSITNAKEMPLRHAVARNNIKMIDTLLLLNPNLINQKDQTGSTVLHQAILLGNRINETTITHLLQKNPDILLIKNHFDRNAFDLAAEQNNTNIMLLLLNQAKRLPPEGQKKFLARVSPNNPYDTIYLYAALEKEDLFFNLLLNGATRTETAQVERVRNNMQTIDFDSHMTKIKEHCALMRQEAAHNPNYHSAVSTADTLIRELTQAKITFLENANTQTFKAACQAAIGKAKPVLSTHRKWGNLLAGLFLALVTLPVSLPLYAFGVFSVKTKSEQLINGLETQINTLTNNHP